jgi:predicted nuclease with TOPRIM domain
MDTNELLLARYYELCDKRDAVNAEVAPHQQQLDEINAEIARLQELAINKKGDIEALRDGPAWLDLKSEIVRIAAVLRFIPARK